MLSLADKIDITSLGENFDDLFGGNTMSLADSLSRTGINASRPRKGPSKKKYLKK